MMFREWMIEVGKQLAESFGVLVWLILMFGLGTLLGWLTI